MDKKVELASRLEDAFSLHGFAEPNVATLKSHTQTTLKTLYKYFPSKEDMIVAALDNRHNRYISFLEQGCPPHIDAALDHILQRLAHWLEHYAPRGCLSLQALASYPNNEQIAKAVNSHKQEVKGWFESRLGDKSLAERVFLIHEGMSSAWPTLGHCALDAAKANVSALLVSPSKV
ncbi:TetR/AcrR family transcriptional regulator [Alteromonas australica]|uniref:TetR/AcrR family transcriptional regulator n=1 Tax=Alteromonas australica TaxID=589873 RepID=UPI0035C83D3B